MNNNDIEKLLKFLITDDDDEETKARIMQMLQELTGVSAVKELDVAAIAKEIEEMPEQEREEARRILAQFRESSYLRQAGAKHPLAGMLGGPGRAEGGLPGPQSPTLVTKEERGNIANLVIKELSKGSDIIQVTEKVSLRVAPVFFRVVLEECRRGPDSFTQYPVGTWSREVPITLDLVRSITQAIAATCEAVACERVTKEPARHPFDGWEFTGLSQSVPRVVTGLG